MYDFMLILLESFVCFFSVYLINDIISVSKNFSSRSFFTTGELTSIFTLISIFILSLGNMPGFFGFKPSTVFVIFLIMNIALYTNISVSSFAGVVFGLAISLTEHYSTSVIGAYAFSAFMASLFRKYSRLGVVLGFTLSNAIITAFLNDTSYVILNPLEVFFVGVLFVGVPRKFLDFSEIFFNKVLNVKETLCADSFHVAKQRISKVSRDIELVADIYEKDCKNSNVGKEYLINLFDYACDNVCANCGLKFGCWKNNGSKNYALMMSLFDKINQSGRVTVLDLPKSFSERCVKKEEFVKVINLIYEIYRTDKLWIEKMNETKKLMANQMHGMTRAIKSASQDLGVVSDVPKEKFLRSELETEGIFCGDVKVFLSDGDIYCVYLEFLDNDQQFNIEKLCRIVSDSIETSVRYNDTIPTNHGHLMCFYPREAYTLSTAVASEMKFAEKVNGDYTGQVFLPDGYGYVMLSDGMASGEKAYRRSCDTVNMMKSFLNAGFDFQSAIKLLNSSLLLNFSKDSFATLDIMGVNLATGKICISKTGSAPTYIKQGNNVKKIESTSLPVGILRDIEFDPVVVLADDYTVVVMMSDGVSNTMPDGIEQGDWIEDELKTINSKNAQLVANKILKRALLKYNGKAEDDMTVTVSIIYKN
jgi:stage II sporulation protein E